MPPLDPPSVKQQIQDGRRVFEANSVPAHPIGDFPNRHDPVPIRPQSLRLEMPRHRRPVSASLARPRRESRSSCSRMPHISTTKRCAVTSAARTEFFASSTRLMK
jgi:hypothetical protein